MSKAQMIKDLEKAIQDSTEWILNLENDWDGKGSIGYKSTTMTKAINFLRGLYEILIEEDNLEIPAPEILPGPNGSIDLHWKTEKFELLINISAEIDTIASFYGDNYGDLKIRGTFDLNDFTKNPLHWLMPKYAF